MDASNATRACAPEPARHTVPSPDMISHVRSNRPERKSALRSALRILYVLAIRPLRDHVSRSVLTVVGVAFGVALYVAIAVVNEATTAHFAEAMSSLAGGATL